MSYILTRLRTNQITKLINEGLSKSEIAEQIGIDVNSVTYWCRKIGVEPLNDAYNMKEKMSSLNGKKKDEQQLHF